MTRGVPVLDPERDLKGATPEKLARALFRRVDPPSGAAVVESVVGDEVSEQEVPADEAGDSVSHLVDGV